MDVLEAVLVAKLEIPAVLLPQLGAGFRHRHGKGAR